ncbi:hypothetical protein Tsubulata_008026, partial [Turnera subulata]
MCQVTYRERIPIWDSTTRRLTDFTSHYSFYIDIQGRVTYAAGFAFFLASAGFHIPTNSAGGFLGLFNLTTNTSPADKIVHIEFDTFPNPEWDPPLQHVGINNNSLTSANYTPWNATLHAEDTADVWITYNSTSKNLTVSWNYRTTSTPQENKTLSYIIDLREALPAWVNIGFSAATSNVIERHVLQSWEFSSNLEINENGGGKNGKKKITLPVVLSVSGAVLVAIVVIAFAILRRQKRRKRDAAETMILTSINDDDLERRAGPRKFSYSTLASATNNFSNDRKLGEGGFGAVYRGYFSDIHMAVAVKKIKRGSKQGRKEYLTEVKVISQLRHRNLVQLMGWCHDRGEFLLVYEFMPNGSLDHHLFGLKDTLSWGARYRIALGLASALLYLHEEWEQCVVHRDVKSSNVMLDSSFNVKLGDFGLARLMDHELGPRTTGLAGTFGYLAPEYVRTGRASKESDVYSFGVVALEIATGRKASDTFEEKSEVSLVEWIWDLYGCGNLPLAVDAKLESDYDGRQIECLMIVGLWCAHPDHSLRPSIRQAIHVLCFEAPLPDLPPKMPVPVFRVPPLAPANSSGSSENTTASSILAGSKQGRKECLTKTTGLAGTLGYLAPKYISTGRASKESDVYSFRVVAVEIVTERKAANGIEPKDEMMGLVEWVWNLYGSGKLSLAIDERLHGEFDRNQVECLMIVGLWCAHPDRTLRPSIRHAIHVLNSEPNYQTFHRRCLLLCIMFLHFPSDSLSFNFTSFSPNEGNISFQGDAFPSANVLQLTRNAVNDNLTHSAGRASYRNPVRLWDAKTGKLTDFTSHFTFIMRQVQQDWYGDGISFFMAPFDSNIPADSVGGYLALFSPANALNASKENQIVAVEFDSFKNDWDPSSDHVGINVNSIVSVAYVSWKTSIKEGDKANAWISYNSTTKNLTVFLTYAKSPVFSGNCSLWYIVDFREYLPELVRIGFSASTGDWVEVHNILSWTFDSTLEVDEVKNGKKRITGLAVGLTVGIGILACGVICCKKEQDFDISMEDEFQRGTGPKRFTYRELSRATNNFVDSGKLGEGGFGGVYKGLLNESNTEVAVKKVSRGSKQGKKEYVSEVRIISRLRHRNLVQLIGWCHEKGEFLLVYEFMPNGSLDSHLFGGKILLAWSVRYKIALGLASALLYLHEEWEQCVVHRDIKSSNVMLDSNFNAKLGDFGLARLVDHELGSQTTVLAGTMGYLAPECVTTGKASKESDVYSFGVVALEIACGRKPVEIRQEPSKVRLVEMVWDLYGRGQLMEAVDKRLSGDYDERQVECLMTVGLWCCHPDYNHRPSIRQVINVLNFEAPLPGLPANLPVPMYYAPPLNMCKFSYTSSGFTDSGGKCRTTQCSCTTSSSTNTNSSAGSSKALLNTPKSDNLYHITASSHD